MPGFTGSASAVCTCESLFGHARQLSTAQRVTPTPHPATLLWHFNEKCVTAGVSAAGGPVRSTSMTLASWMFAADTSSAHQNRIAALLVAGQKMIVASLAVSECQLNLVPSKLLVCRWLAGACALDLAAQVDFPPCLVLRQMLKHLPLSLSKQVPILSLQAAGVGAGGAEFVLQNGLHGALRS